MASAKNPRDINLAVVQQRDPYIVEIVDTASQVALYSFNSSTNEWEKTDVGGTLFVYTRSAAPINGFMILNRLGMNDQIEPINKNLEFQLQDPFLLYRNDKGSIFGIWFYDKDECARIGQLMNSLVQVTLDSKKDNGSGRQRRASESDTLLDTQRPAAVGARGNVDILQMLSKAQDEYDKSKQESGASASGGVEPKALIDNPGAAATKANSFIRPRALKASQDSPSPDEEGATAAVGSGGEAGTQISLESLFRRATSQQQSGGAGVVQAVLGGAGQGPPTGGTQPPPLLRSQSEAPVRMNDPGRAGSGMPAVLQRLMSNPGGVTVEEIERQHRGEIPRDQMPQPAGAEAPSATINGAIISQSLSKPLPGGSSGGVSLKSDDEPHSPNTLLKQTLKIGGSSATKVPSLSASSVPVTSTTSSSHPPGENKPPFSLADFGARLTSVLESSSSGDVGTFAHTEPEGRTRQVSQGVGTRHRSSPALGSSGTAGRVVSGDSGSGSRAADGLPPVGAEDSGSLPARSMSSASPATSLVNLDLSQPVLMTPDAFSTPASFRHTPPVGCALPPPSVFQGSSVDGAVGGRGDGLRVAPLTRDQMQQALLYLIQNDPSFMRILHDAYVKSLHEGFQSSSRS